MKMCLSCGERLRSGKAICGYCGARFAEEIVSKSPSTTPRKQNRGILIGALLGLVSLAIFIGGVLVFGQHGLSAKDVSTKLLASDSVGKWSGDPIGMIGIVSLKVKQSDLYKVNVEQFGSSGKTWKTIAGQSGAGPDFTVNGSAILDKGTNQFRVSIYDSKGRLVKSSEVVKISTKSAILPSTCPVDKFNDPVNGINFQVFGSQVTDGLDCTMAVPNSDYIVRLIYTRVTPDQWQAAMERDGGTPVSLGLGESAAYSYTQAATELTSAFEVDVVDFHGIMINSELSQSGLQIAIDAIPVQENG